MIEIFLLLLTFTFIAAFAAAYLLLLAVSLVAHLGAAASGCRVPTGWFSARRLALTASWVAGAAVAFSVWVFITTPNLY